MSGFRSFGFRVQALGVTGPSRNLQAQPDAGNEEEEATVHWAPWLHVHHGS